MRWRGEGPAQIFGHLFRSALLINKRGLFPPKCGNSIFSLIEIILIEHYRFRIFCPYILYVLWMSPLCLLKVKVIKLVLNNFFWYGNIDISYESWGMEVGAWDGLNHAVTIIMCPKYAATLINYHNINEWKETTAQKANNLNLKLFLRL